MLISKGYVSNVDERVQGDVTPLMLAVKNRATFDEYILRRLKATNKDYLNATLADVVSTENFIEFTADVQLEIISLLLNHGANINATGDISMNTVLLIAVNEYYYRPKLINYLLDRGANINAANFYRKTPLHLVIGKFEESPDMDTTLVELLIRRGADINAVDYREMTSLNIAMMTHNVKLIRLLLQQENLDFKRKDSLASTYLVTAVHLGYDEFIDFLVRVLLCQW